MPEYPGEAPDSTSLTLHDDTKHSDGPNVKTTDARLSDTRTPTDATVTNAKVSATAAIDEAKLSLASDAAAATASRRTLGTGAAQAAQGSLAEYLANKGAASGYMGLDASSRGNQPPKAHNHSAAGDQGGTVAYSSLTGTSVALADVAQATVDALLPWRIDFVPQMKDALVASVGTWIISGNQAQALGSSHLLNSPGAQNDSASIDVVLAKGTWKVLVDFTKVSGDGIAALTLGGSALTSLGGSADTFDSYAAATSYNNLFSSTGIVVAATGKYRLAFTMSSKNASSTGYQVHIAGLCFVRTA